MITSPEGLHRQNQPVCGITSLGYLLKPQGAFYLDGYKQAQRSVRDRWANLDFDAGYAVRLGDDDGTFDGVSASIDRQSDVVILLNKAEAYTARPGLLYKVGGRPLTEAVKCEALLIGLGLGRVCRGGVHGGRPVAREAGGRHGRDRVDGKRMDVLESSWRREDAAQRVVSIWTLPGIASEGPGACANAQFISGIPCQASEMQRAQVTVVQNSRRTTPYSRPKQLSISARASTRGDSHSLRRPLRRTRSPHSQNTALPLCPR